MDADQRYLLKIAEHQIARENENVERALKSKQPRFANTNPDEFWASTYNWLNEGLEQPPYVVDSRKRDTWLRTFWQKELHLAGVLNQSCLIDSNRGWNIIGGRNQVRRYVDISHGLENGKGWRFFQRKATLAFRTSDLGFVGEVGREGRNGPMRTIWTTDPARCKLTGSVDYPLRYYPSRGKSQTWREMDFFRIVSMPSTDENYLDLGFCAVSRAIEIAKTMIAVYQHDQESLGARAPRGLLLLKNISEGMWEQAMNSREAKLDAYERQYYGGVAVLASAGFDDVDAKLIALSQLPKDFDRKVFTDLLMYAYALVFGYDPAEFWPVASAGLSQGQSAAIQHQKASSKGVLDYPNEFQENYQGLLPPTLHFEYDQRDDEGELKAAEVQQAKVNVVKSMYEAGLQAGVPMISQWQAQYLLAESGLIPQEWTATEENITADESDPGSEEEKRWRWSQSEYVIRSAEQFPHEPIVAYQYRSGRGREIMLWEDGREFSRYVPARRMRGSRLLPQVREDTSEVLYEDPQGKVVITENDVTRAIEAGGENIGPEWLEAITNPPMTDEEIKAHPVE